MTLKPEVSIPVALTTAGVVYGVYTAALPNVAEARTSAADDDDLRAAESVAMWASIAVVGLVTLVTRDPIPFIFGGAMAVGLSWVHRHARHVDPQTGRAAGITLGARFSTTADPGVVAA